MNSQNLLIAVDLLLKLAEQSAKVATVIQTAQNENRDVTSEELAQLRRSDDLARERLENAIADAEAALLGGAP